MDNKMNSHVVLTSHPIKIFKESASQENSSKKVYQTVQKQ